MPNIIKIISLSGVSPFNIYTCDTGYTTCIYINRIEPSQIPYSFEIPVIQDGMGSVGVRVVDGSKCEINHNLTI